ncbi:hypothetical protein ACFO5R_22580 [Halosolutus amylolyticus]|uniref:Translation initiation factor IF-2 n=1 Tax=Halosolutus amylolyticus TaxID=2932267 RepID=A0ABD5PXK9_9EURY|nr:hypothetical protein [Halosolutus amylolyticus]
MRDYQQSQSDPTAQIQQTTMTQGQEAMEQAIDLQRNVARMALSAMKWQETAQRQGVELTASMLQGLPGQRFTESTMESYLQGLEAVVPEMERAIETGVSAATQPGSGQGRRMGQPQPSGQMGGQQPTGRPDRQHSGGQQPEPQRRPRQDMGGSTQPPANQYPQTGEWIPQGTSYGGESAGRHPPQQTATGGHPEPQPQPTESPTQTQSRPHEGDQRGTDVPPEGRYQEQYDRGYESGQSTRRRESSRSPSDRGSPRDRPSQRIDTDRRERAQERRHRPIARGPQESGGRTAERRPESEPDRERDEPSAGDVLARADRPREGTDQEPLDER